MTSARPVVFVVDDDASFRTAITRLLRTGGYAFETFQSATEVLERPPADQPGCMIVDLQMPGLSGLDLQDALAKAGNLLPLIFLTGHGDIPASVHAIKGGAEDFLTKPVRREDLFAAIEHALVRDATARQDRLRRNALLARFDKLTPREHEVLAHVVRGQLNKQIAGDLEIAERTIKAHRASIMAKLEVQSVAELARLAQEAGVCS